MATSTFDKQFKVTKKKQNAFTHEFERKVPPTLEADFQSKFKRVHDKNISECLKKALETKAL